MIDQVPAEVAKQPQNVYQLLAVIFTVIIAQVPLWIRELKKHRDFKTKNGQLGEIKTAVEATNERTQKMDKALGIIKNDVANQKQRCTDTVQRIEGGLQLHSNQILELAKNGKKENT